MIQFFLQKKISTPVRLTDLTIPFPFLQFGDNFCTSKLRLSPGPGFSFRPSITCFFTINVAKCTLGEVKIETMRAAVFIIASWHCAFARVSFFKAHVLTYNVLLDEVVPYKSLFSFFQQCYVIWVENRQRRPWPSGPGSRLLQKVTWASLLLFRASAWFQFWWKQTQTERENVYFK